MEFNKFGGGKYWIRPSSIITIEEMESYSPFNSIKYCRITVEANSGEQRICDVSDSFASIEAKLSILLKSSYSNV